MDKEQVLKQFMNLMDSSMSKEEFLKNQKEVVAMVVKAMNKLFGDVEHIKTTYENLLKNLEQKYDISLNDLKGKVDNVFVGEKIKALEDSHNEKMSLVDKKIFEVDSRIAKVKDGYTPIKNKDYFDGQPGKDFPIELGRQFDRDIEELKKEIDAKLEEVKRTKSDKLGMKKIVYTQEYDLSSQVDGSIKTFTVPRKATNVISVKCSQFPFIYRKTVDWTLNGNTITLTSEVQAPQAGQTLLATIEMPFYA